MAVPSMARPNPAATYSPQPTQTVTQRQLAAFGYRVASPSSQHHPTAAHDAAMPASPPFTPRPSGLRPSLSEASMASSSGGGLAEDSATACPEVSIDLSRAADLDVDRLLEPRPREQGTMRCRVKRLREKHTLELFIEEGNVFVLSATRKGKEWIISEQQQGCAPRKHLARLRPGKERTFSFVRARHDGHERAPELLYVTHATQQLSDDLPDLNVMRLAMPRPPLGALDAQHGDLGAVMSHAVERRERTPEHVSILESRRPKWNARTETYELPFGGRANWASARNFQLVERGEPADRVTLLYGKMEEDEFALDFAYPLSLLNAFAIVLTTWGW